MIRPFSQEINQILDAVQSVVPKGEPVYCVGGAVRDHIVQKKIKDLDFVLSGNTQSIALSVKKKLRAKYFILDDIRQTARVITTLSDGDEMVLDFVNLVGSDLFEDLQQRDFTINAMCVDLENRDVLIDPLDGLTDLYAGVLKYCSPTSLSVDPLRILRGIRIKLDYDFEIEPNTTQAMKIAASSLPNVSKERVRDELFKLLELCDPKHTIRELDMFECWHYLVPEFHTLHEIPSKLPKIHDLWNETLLIIDNLNSILTGFLSDDKDLVSNIPYSKDWLDFLWEFQPNLKAHLLTNLHQQRSHKALFLFSSLFTNIDKTIHTNKKQDLPVVTLSGQKLALSNKEIDYLTKVNRNLNRFISITTAEKTPSPKNIYRYYIELQSYGLDVCLLGLAKLFTTHTHAWKRDQWTHVYKVTQKIFHAWWYEHDQVICPPQIMDGYDLQKEFLLSPGPIVGELLEKIREAQVEGRVKTRDEATQFVREILKKD